RCRSRSGPGASQGWPDSMIPPIRRSSCADARRDLSRVERRTYPEIIGHDPEPQSTGLVLIDPDAPDVDLVAFGYEPGRGNGIVSTVGDHFVVVVQPLEQGVAVAGLLGSNVHGYRVSNSHRHAHGR